MVGLETLDGLSTGLRCSLKRSLSHRLVSPMYCLEQWLHNAVWGGQDSLFSGNL